MEHMSNIFSISFGINFAKLTRVWLSLISLTAKINSSLFLSHPVGYWTFFAISYGRGTNTWKLPFVEEGGSFWVSFTANIYTPLDIGEWFYYNVDTRHFHTKKLCSRLYSIELEFYSQKRRIRFLSDRLGELGGNVRTSSISLESAWSTFYSR